MEHFNNIAIIGGGPSGLLLFKRFAESNNSNLEVHIFERKNQLGVGFPYSSEGAMNEHITNVSGNEIPELVTSLEEWIKNLPQQRLQPFNVNAEKFNEYKVLPRLLFGEYLESQFNLLINKAKTKGIKVNLHLKTNVIDVIDQPETNKVLVQTNNEFFEFDKVIICSGHNFPLKYEGKIPNYFESPYPPAKVAFKANHPVALRGSSLTAIDAIRTLARYNGNFSTDESGNIRFNISEESKSFKLIMHSRNGLLPAVRFHLEDSHLSKDSVLSEDELMQNKAQNRGFVSLDFVFEKKFKEPLKQKQPAFYEQIKHMQIEEFVDVMMNMREHFDPFQLLKLECAEAEKSIRQKESVYWKEMLAVLSFDMNYPAKYFSAEDMMRLKKVLMPLISVVIAFVPQSSAREMLALHEAGVLEIISVNDNSNVEPVEKGGAVYNYKDESNKQHSTYYKTYIDCVGQPHLSWQDVPYKSLITKNTISPARVKFCEATEGEKAIKSNKNVVKVNDEYYLNVPGISINDNFQVVDAKGVANERIFMMAVPYIGGFNPDYSGLDFGEAASEKISEKLNSI